MIMKHPYLLLIGILLTGFSIEISGQDPHFSQFYHAPLYLNPAMTGVYEGQYRFAVNYRDQWSSILGKESFKTIGASFDMRYNIVGDDYVAVGLHFLRDQAGQSHFNITRGNLSIAYMKQLGGSRYSTTDQFLIGGVQIGGGQNKIDYSDLWFTRQFDTNNGVVDYTTSSGETINEQTPIYKNVNVGLLWYALFEENMSIYAGGSMAHVNKPKVSFFEGGDERLHSKWTGHAGGEIPLTDELSILPAVMVSGQGSSLESTFGFNFRYSNHDWRELAIRIGGWSRLTNKLDTKNHIDSYIVTAILELERFIFGINYDINSSELNNATNYRGAFEIAVIYTQPEERRIRVKCPNF